MAKPFHGIPTKHKGRQYRSRLEARWATFFDLVGWPYEYEPFDCNGWIPDFALFGATPIAVEVKPVTVFPQEVADQIEASGWPGEAMILGCGMPVAAMDEYGDLEAFRLGWLGELIEADSVLRAPWLMWSGAVLGRYGDPGTLGFGHEIADRTDRISGIFPGNYGRNAPHVPRVLFAWAEAGNRTQWKPPR